MFNKEIKIGLGEAVSRLLRLELLKNNGLHKVPEAAQKERELLFEALNEIKINLGFDCNDDGVPDTVQIFEESANTSCCRIIPSSKKKKLSEIPSEVVLETKPNKQPKRRKTSRRKANK
jgi:hypothetical protein